MTPDGGGGGSAPTSKSAVNLLPVPGGAALEVQPEALRTFANAMFNDYVDGPNQTTRNLSQLATMSGTSGLTGATQLAKASSTSVVSSASYLTDLNAGVMAVSQAAITIAANYVINDDAAADQMADVNAAFNTSDPKTKTVLGMRADAQKASDKKSAEIQNRLKPAALPSATSLTPQSYSTPGSSNQGSAATDDAVAFQKQAAKDGADYSKAPAAPVQRTTPGGQTYQDRPTPMRIDKPQDAPKQETSPVSTKPSGPELDQNDQPVATGDPKPVTPPMTATPRRGGPVPGV